MAILPFVRATELTDLVAWPDLRQQKLSRLPLETAKRRPCSGLRPRFPRAKANLAKPLQQEHLALSVPANRVRLRALLRASSSGKAKLRRKAADSKPRLLVARDLRRRWAKGFPLPLVRVRRCWQGPGPCASSQVKQVARKCSPVARCGGHPIFARYRRPNTRRGPVHYGNSCSRSRRKRARRA